MGTEFKKFTIEGEVVLGFFASEADDRHVRVKTGANEFGERLEQIVARSMNFPNDGEFDEMFEKTASLRDQGLQPADGEPDLVREGQKIRITVEMIDD